MLDDIFFLFLLFETIKTSLVSSERLSEALWEASRHNRAARVAKRSFARPKRSQRPIKMSRGVHRLDVVLLSMLLLTTMLAGTRSTSVRCEDARLRCAYRTGCGMALQHYVTGCASVLQGDNCSDACQHALIALTSTDEGKELMTCQCTRDDELCQQSKQRVEICRSSVTTAMNRTRVSCRIATWICNADALCQTALSYYNKFCKSMFHGKKCTHRCRNSINILTRQEKAAKLSTCLCDGSEEYDCKGIHRNMNTLCFGRIHHDYRQVKKVVDETRTNEIVRTETNVLGNEAAAAAAAATTVRPFVDGTTLAMSVALLLFASQD